MNEKWKNYVDDPRKICKYGSKCYQKNSQHHTTFKHSPLNSKTSRGKRTQHRFNPYSKDKKQNYDSKDAVQKGNKNDKTLDQEEQSKAKADVTAEVEDKSVEKDSNLASILEPDEDNLSETEPSANNNDQKDGNSSITLPNNLTMYDSATNHSLLKELFLVEMPSDFFKLFECLNADNAFEKTLESVNLEPIGPYDLLLGKLPVLDNKELYLTHWRFFYDPPELQAVLKKKGKSEYHIGYFRDDPSEKPIFLASNDSSKDCHLTPMADNIFGAVYLYLQNEKKTSPFTSMMCQKLMDRIKKHAEENNYSVEQYNVKKRLSHVVTKTFHGAGIVVPYNKKTQVGYRRLVETDANIKKLFTKLQAAKSEKERDNVLSELQPIITYASIAVDEFDFGTGVEVGIDLFCSGLKELELPALSSLTAAYSLLNREAFSKILQAHLKHRRRGPNMSILSSYIK